MNRPGDGRWGASERINVDVQRLPANITVVQIMGDLTGPSSATMHLAVREELRRSPAQLIVDVSAVNSIDDDGISALSSAAEIAGEADISFCLVDPNGNPVGGAIASANRTELFEVFETVDDAVREHRPPPPA